MTLQLSIAVRNARANAFESTIGNAPVLEVRTAAPPASCATADTGVLLASITLPSDWLTNADQGGKAKVGTWSVEAVAAGNAGHWRIKQGAVCHAQGTVSATGGSGDLILDNVSIAVGQQVRIDAMTWNEPNS